MIKDPSASRLLHLLLFASTWDARVLDPATQGDGDSLAHFEKLRSDLRIMMTAPLGIGDDFSKLTCPTVAAALEPAFPFVGDRYVCALVCTPAHTGLV